MHFLSYVANDVNNWTYFNFFKGPYFIFIIYNEILFLIKELNYLEKYDFIMNKDL